METTESNKTLHWIEYIAGKSNSIILSQEETCLARQMIEAAESKLKALKIEIRAEKSASAAITPRKAKKLEANGIKKEIRFQRQHLDRLRTAIAPHKLLPSDILCCIFQVATEKTLAYGLLKYFAAWHLLRVCSTWRNLIRREGSRFFNNIAFYDSSHREPPAKISEFVHSLTTIGNPLAPVSFRLSPVNNEVEHEAIILPFHKRIRELSLRPTEKFLAMPKGSFAVLEKLTMNVSYVPYSLLENAEHSCPCFIDMERLRWLWIQLTRYVLESRRPGIFPFIKTVPWSQLLTLKVTCLIESYKSSLTIPVALEILQNCISLEKCTLDVQCFVDGQNHQHDCKPVHVPRLLTLKVFLGCHPPLTCHGSLIDYLVTPALRSLTIEADCDAGPNVSALLRHSSCHLHMLILQAREHYSAWSADKRYLALLEELDAQRAVVVSDICDSYLREHHVIVIKWD